ncbi:MAG: tetraacyldisaccharide 4'-kinase [Candidatus Binatia bacterium]
MSSRQGVGPEGLWYSGSAAARFARAALAPAAAAYGAVVSLRGFLYDRGLLQVSRAPAPVVSVGALRVGGAGKTPFVLWLATRLVARGLRPCIVTRGYGGRGDGAAPRLVTRDLAADPQVVNQAGDEACLLALRSGLPVAVGRDRLAACRLALRDAGSIDLFLLDDGFQHRRLARDLDVVLVSGSESREALLPAGPLREGPGALRRAGIVVRTGAGGLPSAAVLGARTKPEMLVSSVGDEHGEDPSRLAGRRVVAVAAIARPGRFLADLEACGADVVASVLRRDHHLFDADDRREIDEAAAQADLVVTTEKDLVKLAGSRPHPRWRALRIAVEVDDEERLLGLVDACAAFDR